MFNWRSWQESLHYMQVINKANLCFQWIWHTRYLVVNTLPFSAMILKACQISFSYSILSQASGNNSFFLLLIIPRLYSIHPICLSKLIWQLIVWQWWLYNERWSKFGWKNIMLLLERRECLFDKLIWVILFNPFSLKFAL